MDLFGNNSHWSGESNERLKTKVDPDLAQLILPVHVPLSWQIKYQQRECNRSNLTRNAN